MCDTYGPGLSCGLFDAGGSEHQRKRSRTPPFSMQARLGGLPLQFSFVALSCQVSRAFITSFSGASAASRRQYSSVRRPATMSLEGGWAGWEARFSLEDGKPVPVDDLYLPDSYKEWEIDVWGLELQAFDSLIKGASGTKLERVAARYMVEAGCGCENVGKEMFRRFYDGPALYFDKGMESYLALEQMTERLVRVEHGFLFNHNGELSSSRRARVGVEYDASTRALRPTSLVVTLERKWSDDVVDATHSNPFKDSMDTATLRKRIGDPCFSDPEHLAKASAAASARPTSALRQSDRQSFGTVVRLPPLEAPPSPSLSLPLTDRVDLSLACRQLGEDRDAVVLEVGLKIGEGQAARSYHLWRSVFENTVQGDAHLVRLDGGDYHSWKA